MKLNRLGLYLRTIRFLRFRQIFYRLWYFIRAYFPFKERRFNSAPGFQFLIFQQTPGAPPNVSFSDGVFSALNIQHKFEDKVDWNLSEYGKLWTYNLNYFEFLHSESLPWKEGLRLLNLYGQNYYSLKEGLEPYPTSLRIINCIRFLSIHRIKDDKINFWLYKDLLRLQDNLEYHLLGNHLLENAFALLMGGFYFKERKLLALSSKLLFKELQEQVLKDGMHFERSAMYHSIILYRVLEAKDLLLHNGGSPSLNKLDLLLEDVAGRMISWLKYFVESNRLLGFNDSTGQIAQKPSYLFFYSEKLKIAQPKCHGPLDSGFRRMEFKDIKIFINAGSIGPSYQPGHAHADSLSFEIVKNGKPIVVDTGISTYENNDRRQSERSTFAHNTISINKLNSSEVWGGFRVASRASVEVLHDKTQKIMAQHNGYKLLNIVHQREWLCDEINGSLSISDFIQHLKSKRRVQVNSYSCLHFAPDVIPKLKNDNLYVEGLIFSLTGYKSIELIEYQFAMGFNKRVKAIKLVGIVEDYSQIKIYYEN